MVYYLLVVCGLITVYFFIHFFNIKNGDKKFLLLSFIILFFFSALRSENVGTDLLRYKIHFVQDGIKAIQISDLNIFSEFGFTLYNKILYTIFNGDYQYYIAFTSFISLIGVYWFIKENSGNYLMSTLAYIFLNYYSFTFSGIRQSISISIVLFSIKYIKERSFFKFLFVILLASQFHVSSLAFLPAYFLLNYNLSSKKIPIYIFLLFGTYFFRHQIVSFITHFYYQEYQLLTNGGEGYIITLLYLLVFIIITMYKKLYLGNNYLNNLWYNLLGIGILVQLLATVEGNAHRAVSYYLIPIIILIPNLANVFEQKHQKLVKIVLFVLLLSYFIYTSSGKIYEFFWQG